MEIYQWITFVLITSALLAKVIRLIVFDNEISLSIISDIIIAIAIIFFLINVDVSGLKTFCIRMGIVVLIYIAIRTIVTSIEIQFKKEDDKMLDR